jgi:hypothetical protein
MRFAATTPVTVFVGMMITSFSSRDTTSQPIISEVELAIAINRGFPQIATDNYQLLRFDSIRFHPCDPRLLVFVIAEYQLPVSNYEQLIANC